MWWVVAVVALVVLIATYLTWIAARGARLHARATAAYATLVNSAWTTRRCE